MLAVEEIDLLALAQGLRDRFGPTLDQGYLTGRTIMRDAVAQQLGCSVYDAEQLVDTMEARGYLRFPEMDDATHSRRQSRWLILDHD